MADFNLDQYRRDYLASLDSSKKLYVERPALLSPAADAQERLADCQIMYKFISEWMPWRVIVQVRGRRARLRV